MYKLSIALTHCLFLAASFGLASRAANADELWWVQAKHSGKCMSVDEGSFKDNAKISQWDCINQTNVKVRKMPRPNGTFALQFEHSNKCAQVNGASHDDDALVTQWECLGLPNVAWREQPAADGYSFIVNVESGKCLHQHGGTQGNGDLITQWGCPFGAPKYSA